MTRLITGLAAALLAVASPVMAQDATGDWRGILLVPPSTQLRLNVHIEEDNGGALQGTLDSVDQGAAEIPLADIAIVGDRLSFTVPAVGASFVGHWNEDAGEWSGTFSQDGGQFPLALGPGVFAMGPPPPPLQADWTVPDDAEILALLEKRVAERRGVGIALGTITPGGTRVLAAGPAGGPAFDGDTLFSLGSVTKVFTALLLAEMVLEGDVALDDPVAMYLPEGAVMPSRNGKQITLRMLSMQNSGLPRLPDNMSPADPLDPYADYTEELLLEFLANHRLRRDPGAEYEYSNLGVGLLGHVLGRAAGMEYGDLLRERILDPLGMTSSAIILTPELEAHYATPHDEYLRVGKPWSSPTMQGAGMLRSTVNDMLRFLGAALDPQSPIGEAMRLTLSDQLGEVNGLGQTALGWLLRHPPSGEMLMHNGATGGFRAIMALQPDKGRAVVALTNSATNPGVDDLALHVLIGAPALNELPIPPAPEAIERNEISLSAEQLDHVTGVFALGPNAVLTIRGEEDQLTAEITGQRALPIFPSAPLEFFYRIVDARIVFREEDGTVTGGTFYQNGRELVFEKVE